MAYRSGVSDGNTISHYRILEPLGKGGMGEVYTGYDETLKRRVALKAIRAEKRLSARAKARFLREAQVLSQLDHPNVCRIHDYVEGDDSDFLVLELIQGKALRNALKDGLDASSKMQIAEQIAEVLVTTHAAGIVHRDLKPANVMITHEDAVKVLDFGLARFDDDVVSSDWSGTERFAETAGLGETDTRKTVERSEDLRAGLDSDAATRERPPEKRGPEKPSQFQTNLRSIVGTLFYMSPEQARGEPATAVSDMYSFGVLLQELFTERPPYDPSLDDLALMEKVKKAETLPLTGVGPDLGKLILRLESLAPANRPTAIDTLDRLRWIRDKPRRRLRNLAVIGVLSTLALGGLKYTVDLERERTAAVEAREEADRRRTQAEDLIGFMIGDLREKLAPLGRLEILDDIGDKAMDYFASVSEEELTDEELFRRSQALHQIGVVRTDQGDLPAALEAYGEALTLAQRLTEREPDRGEWQLGLAASHFWVGRVLRMQGNLDGTAEHYRAYLEIAERLVAKDPENLEWRTELGYAHYNMARVSESRGSFDIALEQYSNTLEILDEVARHNPEDLDLQLNLSGTHLAVADLLEKMGNLQDAMEHYEADLQIQEALIARDGTNTIWLDDLANSHSYLARLLESLGRPEEAWAHIEAGLSIRSNLVERDPVNNHWRRDLAMSQTEVGLALAERGEIELAWKPLRDSVATFEELVLHDSSNRDWHAQLALSYIALGRALERHGRFREAMDSATAAISATTPLVEDEPGDQHALQWLAEGYVFQGRIEHRLGRSEQAKGTWQRGIDVVAPAARATQNTYLIAVWTRLLLHLDRRKEALPMVGTLRERGYRKRDFMEICRLKEISFGESE